MVYTGDLVPVGTMLVTPGLGLVRYYLASVVQLRTLLSYVLVSCYSVKQNKISKVKAPWQT